MGNRIAIMKDGSIIQTGTAQSIVTVPADDYVAAFVADIDWGGVFTAGDIATDPTTIQLRTTSVREALRIMENSGDRALYVLDGEKVAGGSYRDLATSELDPSTPDTTIRHSMITAYPSVREDTLLHELYGPAEGGLPIAVTDEADCLVSVVTPYDMLTHLSGDADPAQQKVPHAQPR